MKPWRRPAKHIYCEKPFALTKADAAAALEACKRAGIVIGVGHHFRLMPSMRVLAELKEAGAFGTIMHVEGNYSHDWLADYPADSWRMQRGRKPGRRHDRHGHSCARLLP